jgi:hypothetical protein
MGMGADEIHVEKARFSAGQGFAVCVNERFHHAFERGKIAAHNAPDRP